MFELVAVRGSMVAAGARTIASTTEVAASRVATSKVVAECRAVVGLAGMPDFESTLIL